MLWTTRGALSLVEGGTRGASRLRQVAGGTHGATEGVTRGTRRIDWVLPRGIRSGGFSFCQVAPFCSLPSLQRSGHGDGSFLCSRASPQRMSMAALKVGRASLVLKRGSGSAFSSSGDFSNPTSSNSPGNPKISSNCGWGSLDRWREGVPKEAKRRLEFGVCSEGSTGSFQREMKTLKREREEVGEVTEERGIIGRDGKKVKREKNVEEEEIKTTREAKGGDAEKVKREVDGDEKGQVRRELGEGGGHELLGVLGFSNKQSLNEFGKVRRRSARVEMLEKKKHAAEVQKKSSAVLKEEPEHRRRAPKKSPAYEEQIAVLSVPGKEEREERAAVGGPETPRKSHEVKLEERAEGITGEGRGETVDRPFAKRKGTSARNSQNSRNSSIARISNLVGDGDGKKTSAIVISDMVEVQASSSIRVLEAMTAFSAEPFPNYERPYPDECREVEKRLAALHGAVQRSRSRACPSLMPGEHMEIVEKQVSCREGAFGEDESVRMDECREGIDNGCIESGERGIQIVKKEVIDELLRQKPNFQDVGEEVSAEVVPRRNHLSVGTPLSVLDSLIRTLLSQNTTDSNSRRAFASLKSSFPTWEEVLSAEPQQLQDAIRCGGLAEIKAQRIREILNTLNTERGRLDLEYIRDLSTEEVKAELSRFKGVGPKTIACVLMFHLEREEFPVDTHVFRITKMLGWVPPSADRERAYLHLNRRVPDEAKYGLHCLLVAHGKGCERCAKGRAQRAPKGPCPLTNWNAEYIKFEPRVHDPLII